MKALDRSILPLVVLSVVLSLSAIIAVAWGLPEQRATTVTNIAAVRHAAPMQTVRVVMHDPGCHWFQANGNFTRAMTVKGPVKLLNLDEAALQVAGATGTHREAVGARLRLAPGTYRITMVGQAADDNHLRLVVS